MGYDGSTLMTIVMFAITSAIGLVFYGFMVFCFWRIFKKAGQNGAMAFLCLIPGVGMLVVVALLAFGTWPARESAKE